MHKGVVVCTKEGSFLNCLVLVSGRDDHPGQSKQAYQLHIDFWDINKHILVDGYSMLDL